MRWEWRIVESAFSEPIGATRLSPDTEGQGQDSVVWPLIYSEHPGKSVCEKPLWYTALGPVLPLDTGSSIITVHKEQPNNKTDSVEAHGCQGHSQFCKINKKEDSKVFHSCQAHWPYIIRQTLLCICVRTNTHTQTCTHTHTHRHIDLTVYLHRSFFLLNCVWGWITVTQHELDFWLTCLWK